MYLKFNYIPNKYITVDDKDPALMNDDKDPALMNETKSKLVTQIYGKGVILCL